MDTDGSIGHNRQRISHHSISSQSSSIAGDETVLFILMVTALQQTDEEENRDGNSRREAVITPDTARKTPGLVGLGPSTEDQGPETHKSTEL